jgi:hypothetical protein
MREEEPRHRNAIPEAEADAGPGARVSRYNLGVCVLAGLSHPHPIRAGVGPMFRLRRVLQRAQTSDLHAKPSCRTVQRSHLPS